MEIKGFSKYYYKQGNVFCKRNDRQVSITTGNKNDKFLKLKDDFDKWKSVQLNRVKFLAGDILKLPDDAVKAAYCEWLYVTPDGRFFSFGRNSLNGKEMLPYKGKNGYLRVKTLYKGKSIAVECHKVICETFIDKDYIAKGLVCLHKDDNKTNCNLSNLKVGTHSENNKSAYKNGLNTSNSEALKRSPKKGNRVDWPDSEVLNKMYSEMTLVDIGKHFNCSDNAVKKRLRKIGVIK